VYTFLDSNPSLDLNIVQAAPIGLPGRELPLHLASGQYSDEQIVGRLLAAGANPESFCGHGRNALQCIAYAGYLDYDSLGWLTRRYTREAKKKYIDSLDQCGDRRAAHYVAESSDQNLEGVSALGNAGVNWRLKNKTGHTPFEWAVKHGHWIITSHLAKVLWDLRPFDKESDFSVCRWTQVNVQNVSMMSIYCESSANY
jgi:ankyrin repeat protein